MPNRSICPALLVVFLAMPLPAANPVQLFNGKDLSGWTATLWDRKTRVPDTTTPASDVWMVKDGLLICLGKPAGYLRTMEEYGDYRLEVDWRWPAGATGGNNGVLVHVTGQGAPGQWPKSVEVQLAQGDAGDFWVMGTTMNVAKAENRRDGRRLLNFTDDSEKPAGEWNEMVIEARGAEIKVWVNGKLVNHGVECSETRGAIALQSEGAVVEFRRVVLTPIK